MTRLLLAVFSATSVMFIVTACDPSAQWVGVPLLICLGKQWNDIKKTSTCRRCSAQQGAAKLASPTRTTGATLAVWSK